MAKAMRTLKINKKVFSDIIAELMWVSRKTLDRDRLLTHDEYLEKARRIFDRMGTPVDYLDAEEAYIKQHEARERRTDAKEALERLRGNV